MGGKGNVKGHFIGQEKQKEYKGVSFRRHICGGDKRNIKGLVSEVGCMQEVRRVQKSLFQMTGVCVRGEARGM